MCARGVVSGSVREETKEAWALGASTHANHNERENDDGNFVLDLAAAHSSQNASCRVERSANLANLFEWGARERRGAR